VKAKKPILIEKPLAPTGREARAMVTAAEEAGLLLMTAQTMRFDSTILLLKDHLPEIDGSGTPPSPAGLKQSQRPGSVTDTRSARALLEFGVTSWIWCLSHRRRGGRRSLRVGPASERGTGHDGDRAGPDRERHAMRLDIARVVAGGLRERSGWEPRGRSPQIGVIR